MISLFLTRRVKRTEWSGLLKQRNEWLVQHPHPTNRKEPTSFIALEWKTSTSYGLFDGTISVPGTTLRCRGLLDRWFLVL